MGTTVRQQAEKLIDNVADLQKRVLLRHTTAVLEEIRDQIVLRDDRIEHLVTAMRSLLGGEICRFDPLNPCWNNRETDAPGKHWAGGSACCVCSARAAIVKSEGA